MNETILYIDQIEHKTTSASTPILPSHSTTILISLLQLLSSPHVNVKIGEIWSLFKLYDLRLYNNFIAIFICWCIFILFFFTALITNFRPIFYHIFALEGSEGIFYF